MKSCPRRLSAQGVGVLALVMLLAFFALSSLIKEPNLKPSRYQLQWHHENQSQRPPRVGQSGTGAESEPEKGDPVAHPGPTVLEPEEGPVMTTLQEEERPPTATLPQRGLDKEVTSGRPSQNQDRGQGEPRTPKTAFGPHPSKAAATKTTVTKTTSKMLTTGTQKRMATTRAVPAKEKLTQATPCPGTTPSPAPFSRSTIPRSQRLKAANFKSEPRWDFDEKYSFDVGGLQTTCPDSLKIKAAKSPWLQHLFLPNLTLFLDSSSFSQSEWNRLEHFGPPFGFMELNQSLVQRVVSQFPLVPQQQLLLASLPAGSSRCITCAVVGNGGILNDSHVGQEIDSHDYVFRLSGAVIKGYEQDVGNRTSFYGFTAFSVTQSITVLGRQGFRHVPVGKDVRYLHFLEGTRDFEWLEAMLLNHTLAQSKLYWFRRRPQEAFQENVELERYFLLHPDFIRYMKNRFLRSKTLNGSHWRIYRPTTGALLLFTALHLCDKVSAYGFITEGHERFSDHYYDKTWKRLIFYINHDFKLEKAVWKRLHEEGIIKLYQRPQNADANS